MSAISPTHLAGAAVQRAYELLKILDREHTHVDLYRQLKGIRHEVATALMLLPASAAPRNRSNLAWRAKGTQPDSHRHLLMRALSADPGMSAPVLAGRINARLPVVRTRLRELASAEWIAPYGTSLDAATKRKTVLWMLSTPGKTALAKLESGQLALIEA